VEASNWTFGRLVFGKRGFLPEVLNLEVTSFMQSFKWKTLIMNALNNKLEEL